MTEKLKKKVPRGTSFRAKCNAVEKSIEVDLSAPSSSGRGDGHLYKFTTLKHLGNKKAQLS